MGPGAAFVLSSSQRMFSLSIDRGASQTVASLLYCELETTVSISIRRSGKPTMVYQ
jgi:hypothetical protein